MNSCTDQDTISEDISQAPMSCYQKMDSWDVKYLCTIFLLDSESNHTYKCIRREATGVSIEYRKISPEQYSIPQRSDVAHRINQILVFDYQKYI